MPETLDLYDIQGNIVKAYGRYSFRQSRYVFYSVTDGAKGRVFIKELLVKFGITNAAPWEVSDPPKPIDQDNIPDATTNIAFTYSGLQHLGLPQKSLQSFPQEFAMGMKARRDILGDDGPSAPQHWDHIWNDDLSVDIFLSINGQSPEALAQRYQGICNILKDERVEGGVLQLDGHAGPNSSTLAYQDAAVLSVRGEHFGYADGISEPYFEGCGTNPIKVIGGGKPTRKDPYTIAGWEPLETGEFILGYRDESQEYPKAPVPKLLSFNGSFMVYRKLHENVASFQHYIEEMGKDYPGGKEALAAKFVGRWRNGAPLALFPTESEANAFISELIDVRDRYYQAYKDKAASTEALRKEYDKLRLKLVGFNFNHDIDGGRCPYGSHTRRINPRGALEFGQTDAFETPGALTNRRRLLRRGLPYGKTERNDGGNHGIIFMALCASLERQFEFVQQQWVNYGNDFKLASERDPILGNHGQTPDGKSTGRMVIEAPKDGDQPPFICAGIKRFVETRGGEYFFIPSITAVRMIAEGIIDPT